ncbi:MAG TPA: patatin-like phospholipase family protein [Beijerinckiaceae bacterium]|jgi:NTE family protein|nr:patatin-like phospholipase family protein [Beijerinckiaceae bacterium]
MKLEWLEKVREFAFPQGADSAWPPRRLSLALQGGGSFGAFTWGVLDRLLDEEDIEFDAISGASAGAINAVLLAAGLVEGGHIAAKAKLESFWRKISTLAPFTPFSRLTEFGVRRPREIANWLPQMAPAEFNPFDLNPLRAILGAEVDFAQLNARSNISLLIAATRVEDGRLHIFRNGDLDADKILASACLPSLHHTVYVDGVPYWDGGYAANPPLVPLALESAARDILLVQVLPSKIDAVPTTAPGIARRVDRICLNAPLWAEIAAIESLRTTRNGGSSLCNKLDRLSIHRLVAEEEFDKLALADASSLDWSFLVELRDCGRAAAENWLQQGSDSRDRRVQ